MIKTYVSPRDNLFLMKYVHLLDWMDIVNIEFDNLDTFIDTLVYHNIELVIQIAPQWEWGKYVEEISMRIMDAGIKLLCGEGAMFRSFGEDYQCGSDVGFYLSPWGYSGNSKLSKYLPKPTFDDIIMAKKFMSNQTKWSKTFNNGLILILGQLDYDRSKFYSINIKTNDDLIKNLINFYGRDQLVFRPHPLDNKNYDDYKITIQQPTQKLRDIVHLFSGVISINSTSSIEAMCSGVPVFNYEISPWSACNVVSVGKEPILNNYNYEYYINDIASLIHLHYIGKYNFGSPVLNALNFYSNYDRTMFKYSCINRSEEPQIWDEKYRNL